MSTEVHRWERPATGGGDPSGLANVAARLRGERSGPPSGPAAPGLQHPKGAQGPGKIPIGRLAALDLRIRRRTNAPLPGEHLAVGAGLGIELAQLRAYVPGDDVRAIDASATARTGVPHVRVHVPERAVTTWIVLDRSPSMAFGTADRLKADVAVGVVTAMGRLATRRGNRVGLITCGAQAERVLPPRGGRGALMQLERTLREGVAADEHAGPGLAHGLKALMGHARGGHCLIVVVSDFLEAPEEWSTGLAALRHRHDLVAVEVRDPRDEELPDVGSVWLTDPRTGRQLQVDTGSRKLRARFAQAAVEREAKVHAALRKAGARHAVCRTDADWLDGLAPVLR